MARSVQRAARQGVAQRADAAPLTAVDIAWLIRDSIDGNYVPMPNRKHRCIASMEMDGSVTVQVDGISVFTVKVARRRAG